MAGVRCFLGAEAAKAGPNGATEAKMVAPEKAIPSRNISPPVITEACSLQKADRRAPMRCEVKALGFFNEHTT